MLQIVINPNCYLETLKKAINEVDENYYNQQYLSANGALRMQKPERVFVAEIYHQLRKLQESADCIADHYFHIEITKTGFSDVVNNECNFLVPSQLSPDIVLHRSQNDSQSENQVLICEVKMEGRDWPSIKEDLKRLLFYKISRLNFQNAVFIYSGDISHINKKLATKINSANFTPCLKTHNIIFCAKNNDKNKDNRWELYELV